MNRIFYARFLSLCLLLAVTADYVMAQKNFFEVPSGEIIEQQEFFFQTQAVFTRNEANVMAGVTYGIFRHTEVGIAFNQWDFQRGQGLTNDAEHPEQSPDILLTVQRAFPVTAPFGLNVGFRSGINGVGKRENLSFADFSYVTGRYTFGDHALAAGGYYANRAFEGEGKHFGFMAGAELSLVKDKLKFVADFLSGNSALSIVNAGLAVALPHHWCISAGAQLPWPHSDNPYGATVQLSWN